MCKCCETIKWWRRNKDKNDKLFSKIAVYGWREGERRIKGRQNFDYTTKAYELNYCPMCGRKLEEK